MITLHILEGWARVESVYSTPKIFGVKFENSWRSGVRSFTFTSVGASRKSTCCRFNLFLESYLWRGKVKFGIICDLGVTFNKDWRIFGVRFTRIPPWGMGLEKIMYVRQWADNVWNNLHFVILERDLLEWLIGFRLFRVDVIMRVGNSFKWWESPVATNHPHCTI